MSLPRGPRIPDILQSLQWMASPLKFLEGCAKRYGSIFTVRLTGKPPVIFLSNSEALEEIFRGDAEQFKVGQGNTILRPLLGENSLFFLDGERHKHQRQMLSPPFHARKVEAYAALIHEVVIQAIQQWNVGEACSLHKFTRDISLQLIVRIVLGISKESTSSELENLIARCIKATNSPVGSILLFTPSLQRDFGVWSPWGNYSKLIAQLDRLLHIEIAGKRCHSGFEKSSVLGELVSMRDDENQPMTDVEIRDELMTLLIAGHETIASTLAWVLWLLYRHPRILKKLKDELRTVDLSVDVLKVVKLPYFDSIFKEVLRLYPVTPIAPARVTQKLSNVMGYELEPNSLIVPCIYLVHHNPDLYSEPKEFRPERFFERNFSASEYFPFGGGNRLCIGMSFAQFQIKLAVAIITSYCDLEFTHDRVIKPVCRGMTIFPPNSLKVALKNIHCNTLQNIN